MVELRFTIAAVSIGVALSVPAGAAPIPSAMRIASLAPACTFASEVSAAVADPSATAGDYSPEFDRVLGFDRSRWFPICIGQRHDWPKLKHAPCARPQRSGRRQRKSHPARAPGADANSGLHAKFPDCLRRSQAPSSRLEVQLQRCHPSGHGLFFLHLSWPDLVHGGRHQRTPSSRQGRKRLLRLHVARLPR